MSTNMNFHSSQSCHDLVNIWRGNRMALKRDRIENDTKDIKQLETRPRSPPNIDQGLDHGTGRRKATIRTTTRQLQTRNVATQEARPRRKQIRPPQGQNPVGNVYQVTPRKTKSGKTHQRRTRNVLCQWRVKNRRS